MNLRQAALIAACMFAAAADPAAAQSPWPAQQQPATAPWPQQQQQQQQQSAASPWSQQPVASPWSQPQPQQMPPCIQEFGKLRDDAQKRAGAIRTASARKATAKEACALFNAFSAAEMKMIKYATSNAASCGIPAEVLTNLNQGHAKTAEIRTKVCQAAAAPMQQQAPSLSDALVAPVPDSNNIKTGRGTFDTLSGTPLGK